MNNQKFDLAGLLDLPHNERKVYLHLFREGSCDAVSIAGMLGLDIQAVQEALAVLKQKGRVRQNHDEYEIVPTDIPPRKVPDYLWSAFLTPDRLYSEQEIAALRTAVPMLQFARARLSEFTDHGPGHAFRVKSLAQQLGFILDLTTEEHQLLRAGALFHDVGNVVERGWHNIISQETVLKLAEQGELPFNQKEAEVVGLLCRWHRKEYEPERVDVLRGETIRTGLLASTLRVADSMDIDFRRSDQGEKFRKVLAFFFPDELKHWNSADEIYGVRFLCNPGINIQVFTKGHVADNLQIEMLRGDAASTPLKLGIVENPIEVSSITSKSSASQVIRNKPAERNVLLVFPFEPHSLIMAGLSFRHLDVAGYHVETFCCEDTPDAPGRLWEQVITAFEESRFDRIIVTGDRPTDSLNPQIIQVVNTLRSRNIGISIMNRHETNWHRVPELLKLGAEVVLGGDWAYFWGDPLDASVFKWGRVACLCTRDPTQATVDITREENNASKGFLFEVFSAIDRAEKESEIVWGDLANPLLERIVANDLEYFCWKADEFSQTFAKSLEPDRVEGKVGIFEQTGGESPSVNYWMMESTIEKFGRVLTRNVQFNLPYMLSTWIHDQHIDLLAINHWRDDTAIPIRLLYPGDMAPAPMGNETTVCVRLSPSISDKVIRAFVNACNQSYHSE